MKTRILGMLLCLLCLLGCGGKKTQKAETYPLGASGFPEWIKVAWRVSQEDTTVIVAMVNKSEKDCTLLMSHRQVRSATPPPPSSVLGA